MRPAIPQLSLLLAASVLVLDSCTLQRADPGSRATLFVPRQQRELTLQQQWRGQSFDALVDAFGVPSVAMTIPGRHEEQTFAVYYGVQDAATRCIDAFTIVVDRNSKRQVVAEYFCR